MTVYQILFTCVPEACFSTRYIYIHIYFIYIFWKFSNFDFEHEQLQPLVHCLESTFVLQLCITHEAYARREYSLMPGLKAGTNMLHGWRHRCSHPRCHNLLFPRPHNVHHATTRHGLTLRTRPPLHFLHKEPHRIEKLSMRQPCMNPTYSYKI